MKKYLVSFIGTNKHGTLHGYGTAIVDKLTEQSIKDVISAFKETYGLYTCAPIGFILLDE